MHLLIYPGHEPHSAADFLYSLKKSVTNRTLAFVRHNAPGLLSSMVNRRRDGSVSHRRWRRDGGYDEHPYLPHKIGDTIDYTHANPGPAGLCEDSAEWKWSSALAYDSCGLDGSADFAY